MQERWISNGDLFLNGNTDEEHAANYIGNNHGGLLKLKMNIISFIPDKPTEFLFQTGLRGALPVDENGTFLQAEMTSCGLNGGPLEGRGSLWRRIASQSMVQGGNRSLRLSAIKQRYKVTVFCTGSKRDGGARQYIANMQDGSVAGFKYFQNRQGCENQCQSTGTANGMMRVYQDADRKQAADCIPLNCTPITGGIRDGKHRTRDTSGIF